MKDKCPGSGKRPKRIDSAGLADCARCGATIRLRKDGMARSHYRVEDAQAIVADLWSLFGRR